MPVGNGDDEVGPSNAQVLNALPRTLNSGSHPKLHRWKVPPLCITPQLSSFPFFFPSFIYIAPLLLLYIVFLCVCVCPCFWIKLHTCFFPLCVFPPKFPQTAQEADLNTSSLVELTPFFFFRRVGRYWTVGDGEGEHQTS